ncbi:hypothetical protein HDV01_002474 [Terramyces sp. JEL0728]|nr:hypothetical protein HDV01_002432 [Terramyces sp. JEL0728]KAJ3274632.1 hypothetical protein HDV01_002474 [Terramyces sp. JEL0728]
MSSLLWYKDSSYDSEEDKQDLSEQMLSITINSPTMTVQPSMPIPITPTLKRRQSAPYHVKKLSASKSPPNDFGLPTPSSYSPKDKLKQKWICDACGKTYKHPNCLSKHKWEHTDYWKETSKLAISKHAQVQLLEAASVLIGFQKDEDLEYVNGQVWDK